MTTKRILLAVMCTLLVLTIVMFCIVSNRINALFSGPQLSTPPTGNTEASQESSTPPSSEATQATEPSSQPTDPTHEHKYAKTNTVPPTCTAYGYTVYTCSCGKTDLPEDEFVQPAGHNYVAGETVKRTCTTDGYTTYTCSSCGDSDKRDYLKAEGHTLGIGKVTKPTCTEIGFTTYTCSVCGENTVKNQVEATGHEYSEWVVLTEASDTAPGKRQQICSACQEVNTEIVPPTGELKITNGDGHGTVTSKYDSNNIAYRRYTFIVGTQNTPQAYIYTVDYYVTGGALTCAYGEDGLTITYTDADGNEHTRVLPPYADSGLVIRTDGVLPSQPEDPDEPSDPTESTDPTEASESTDPTEAGN